MGGAGREKDAHSDKVDDDKTGEPGVNRASMEFLTCLASTKAFLSQAYAVIFFVEPRDFHGNTFSMEATLKHFTCVHGSWPWTLQL